MRHFHTLLAAFLAGFPLTLSSQNGDPTHAVSPSQSFLSQDDTSWTQAQHVRKMSHDPAEKFWPHYLDFSPALTDESALAYNASDHDRSIGPHERHARSPIARSLFSRDFKCPDNTGSCGSVGSDLCCPSGQYCVNLASGIGCCPNGQTCAGAIAGCDTNAGYISCPNSQNGGCCVPGSRCEGQGCVFYGTAVILATPSRSTQSSTSSSTSSFTSPTIIMTVTVTQIVGGLTTTIISPTTVYTQSSQAVTSSTISTTTATASSPLRPTSITSNTSRTAPATSSLTSPPTDASCPTGYYMCSAVYLGGCCQVDRNCDTTNCPAGSSTTILTSGPTIIASIGSNTSRCANGWALCATSDGGGCCPSGYVCGSVSCTATVDGQANTAKLAPQGHANLVKATWGSLCLAFFTGIGMVVL